MVYGNGLAMLVWNQPVPHLMAPWVLGWALRIDINVTNQLQWYQHIIILHVAREKIVIGRPQHQPPSDCHRHLLHW